jgi:DNA-binding CsgD family transcriptional regulator
VALFDLSASRIMAVSESGYVQLGLVDADLGAYDFVTEADDPEGVRQLVSLICDRNLKEWRWRSRLYTADGRRSYGYATGRVVAGMGSRVVCLARYHWPIAETDEVEVDVRMATSLLEPAPEMVDITEMRSEERRLAERVSRLERQLHRIAQEVEAAGLITIVSALPEPSAVPGLADLSARQWEVVTRLLRGERVPTIARGMFLSASTVRNHLATIYRKVGVGSQAELLELLHGAREQQDSTRPSDSASR